MAGSIAAVWLVCGLTVLVFGLTGKEELPGDSTEAQSAVLFLMVIFSPLTALFVVGLVVVAAAIHLGEGFADLWRQFHPSKPTKLPPAKARKKTIDV